MEPENFNELVHSLKHLKPEHWQSILAELAENKNAAPDVRTAIYQIRISYDLVNAIHRLDHTSSKLTKHLIILTWLIVILTALLAIEPIIHFFK